MEGIYNIKLTKKILKILELLVLILVGKQQELVFYFI